MPWLQPVTLEGPHARLEPLSQDHREALVDAVKDGGIWKIWYTFVPAPEKMGAEIERRLSLQAAGTMLPFTVRDAEGRIAGMTTYTNVDSASCRVEIGSTWYAKRVQRTAVNTQCKLLLLTHAFEKLNASPWNSVLTFQSCQPAWHRAARRQTGGHPARSSNVAKRDGARHRRLQHPSRRVAEGEGASHLRTQ